MLNATRDLTLPTTVTGSWPRPSWFTEVLRGRPFKEALGDSRFREQYMDAVSCIIKEQEMAGLDIVTDGDSRFDLTVGGKSWFFYPIERLLGITGHVDRAAGAGWTTIQPGRILYEVMEAYQPAIAGEKLRGGPLQYAALFKVAQRFSARPVKFGSISAQTMTKMITNKHYGSDRELQFLTDALNREIKGVETEVWLHTCWGNPSQQPIHWTRPSYERALPHLLQTTADVITLECASTGGRDLPLLAKYRTDKKVAIGVVNHSTAAVEPPEVVADLIRRALEYVAPERLILSSDCGFGREGLSRRIAFYKTVAINLGANIVRRELKLPAVDIPAADPRYTFSG